ncbi:hypothetical protein HMPREF1079_00766 [Bacteroides fragilis CL05T00C42]|uniref:Uncharacterized protein n=1 Tax=Bacteroides fragilis CL05T12C13 TaxID=997881 RepID=I9BKJ2_BACFG|nr:hypothetical protein HMPREF1079_00766 [Bacteroides fragilis CL05T00C42]EIZ00281.1 hypothetical protein HMPREF1080_01329 [Bacteroides fragilis CL05T12C13]
MPGKVSCIFNMGSLYPAVYYISQNDTDSK